MPKKIDTPEIVEAAQRLVARYGKNAPSIAQEKANEAGLSGCLKRKDIALRILTEVEKLLNTENV